MIKDIHGDQANISKVHNMTFDWLDGKGKILLIHCTHTTLQAHINY